MLLLRRVPRSVTIAAALAYVLIAARASAGVDPGLEWKTISTEHFDVHFHAGEEWTGAEAARIAEEIYGPITDVYDYRPKRCHLVILDTEDYANGAAYYYDNKIEIWATNLEFHLRGTTPWLRNVITHEFTHIVSIQASMKMPLRIPAIYFQAVDFEKEKRPDVITGYPDLIVSYPITGTVVPGWWAEGVAQYQSPVKHNDCWDTHRDMILRAAVTEDRMLSYDEMGFLGHTQPRQRASLRPRLRTRELHRRHLRTREPQEDHRVHGQVVPSHHRRRPQGGDRQEGQPTLRRLESVPDRSATTACWSTCARICAKAPSSPTTAS